MDHDDISSLTHHIEAHLSYLREALAQDNAIDVASQAEEIEGWARSIAEAASGGKGPRPEPRSATMLTPAQLKSLRAADAKSWFPVGGPEHRVARRLAELGLYSSGTGKPTDRGRAYLARVTK